MFQLRLPENDCSIYPLVVNCTQLQKHCLLFGCLFSALLLKKRSCTRLCIINLGLCRFTLARLLCPSFNRRQARSELLCTTTLECIVILREWANRQIMNQIHALGT